MNTSPAARNACPSRRSLVLLAPIALALVGLLLPRDPLWPRLALHTALEALGAVVAIALAILMLTFPARRGEPGMPAAIPMGLFALGVLAGCYAISEPGHAFMWLQSLALCISGLAFASIWLPFGQVPAATHRGRVLAVAGVALMLGVSSLILAGWAPGMRGGIALGPWATGLDLLGAALFFLAAVRLCMRYQETRDLGDRLFALLCALLGASGLLFLQTGAWTPAWWWLHLLRWGAYALVFLVLMIGLGRAFRAQMRAEDYWRSIIDSSNDAIVGTDAQGTINLWNRAAEGLFGYAREEIIGQPVSLLLATREPTRQAALLERIRRGECLSTDEETLYRKDGSEVTIDITCSPIRDLKGTVLGASGIIRDVSERRRTRMRLESLLRFNEMLIAQSPVGIAVYREEGRCLMANAALAVSVGASVEQLLAQSFRAIPSWQASGLLAAALDVLASGRPRDCLAEIETSFGNQVVLACAFTVIEEAEQRHLLLMASDVTAMRKAERALRLSEEQFRQIFERMSGGVAVYEAVDEGADFVFVDINPAVERIEGVRGADIVGRRLTEVFPGVREFGFLGVLHEVWRTGEAQTHPLTLYRDERIVGWRENDVYRLSSGKVVAVYEDLTERKRAEEEMRMAHDRLLLAARAAEIGIWSWDFATNRLTWDARMCALYAVPEGFAASGVFYDVWRARCHPDDLADTEAALRAARDGDGDFDRNFRIVLPDGGLRYLHAAALVERDASGRRSRMVGINRDITAQRETEQKLREGTRAADAASRAKSAFLANMSHEIRTPMNAVIGLSQLLLDTQLDARQRDYLDKIERASKALLRILNDILDYSKIEAGRLELDAVDFQLDEILDATQGVFAFAAGQKGLELLFDIDPGVPAVMRGDPLRLGQVINNLVGNAVKFTDAGEIQLQVACAAMTQSEVELRIAVRDTGIGLSAQQCARLFDPFQQADSSISRRFGGTGLGLTISRRLVEMMGGQIEVDSRRGAGSTFSFRVRLGRSAVKPPEPHAGRPRPPRTLVVDDQPTARALMKKQLAALACETTLADSAEAGLRALVAADRKGAPMELLLIDWRMPGLDGIEMVRRLAAMVANGEVAPARVVMMVTAFGRGDVQAARRDIRLDALLEKPVKPSALRALLSQLEGPPRRADHTTAPRALQGYRELTRAIHGARILLVEDLENNRLVAQDLLTRMGLLVTTASNGQAALERVAASGFDAILMDLQMPRMDGFEATRAIRAMGTGADIPIIALTAAAMADDARASVAAGMNAHLAKPIDPERLAHTLVQWIAPRMRGRAAPTLERRSGGRAGKHVQGRADGMAEPDLAGVSQPVDWGKIRPQLRELEAMLLKKQGKARRQAEALGAALSATALADAFEQLHQHIRRLEFKDAVVRLRALLALEGRQTP
ncbi:PAS domain S-box protein [Thiocystis violacea]|uniref:PAS domain S-box protein n=1 Tax=Thiocystis violacea TaxID=13725 RepID=UPI001905ECB1|nr:PAS domain S-box protein [Thiocystis violacea]